MHLGCQCDIGGSVGQACNERHGRCRCRPNVEGPKCNQWVTGKSTYRCSSVQFVWGSVMTLVCLFRPRLDHYFPDLHHMKFEVEEGTTMDGRPVRFGYNPLEFESFSWRGYAQMSPIQVHKHTLIRLCFHLENDLMINNNNNNNNNKLLE